MRSPRGSKDSPSLGVVLHGANAHLSRSERRHLLRAGPWRRGSWIRAAVSRVGCPSWPWFQGPAWGFFSSHPDNRAGSAPARRGTYLHRRWLGRAAVTAQRGGGTFRAGAVRAARRGGSAAASELLRHRLAGDRDVTDAIRPPCRELVAARIMDPVSTWVGGPESAFRFTRAGWERPEEWINACADALHRAYELRIGDLNP